TITQLTQHIDADTAAGEHHGRRATSRLYITERDRQPCCTGPRQRFGTVVADHLDPTHRVLPFPLAAFLPVPLLDLPEPPPGERRLELDVPPDPEDARLVRPERVRSPC